MKFGKVLAFAAVTALCEALVHSEWGESRVRAKRHRMERIYGPNLVGLWHEETGHLDHKRFSWSRTRPKQMYMDIDGVVFDADTISAVLLGITSGMQYKEVSKVSQPMSNCFFASTNIIDDVEGILETWDNLGTVSGEFNWFDVFIYGPLHTFGDAAVSVEHCDLSKYTDLIANLAGLDFGLIGERITSIGLDIGLNWQNYSNQVMGALGWYAPPILVPCDEASFTTPEGGLDSAAYKKCLTKFTADSVELEEYNKWSQSCMAIYTEEVAAALQAEIDKAQAEADGTAVPDDSCDFWCQTFGSVGLFKKPQKLQSEMITEEAREACKTYGHTGETNFYNLGLFFGNLSSMIFATQVVS